MGEAVISEQKSEQKKLRKEARELLLKARIYRFFALAFAFSGLIIFLFLYFQNIDGRLLDALSNLKTIFIILVPFLPAALLTALAARTESKFYDLVHTTETPAGADPAKKGK